MEDYHQLKNENKAKAQFKVKLAGVPIMGALTVLLSLYQNIARIVIEELKEAGHGEEDIKYHSGILEYLDNHTSEQTFQEVSSVAYADHK